jgi:hypothetical protein
MPTNGMRYWQGRCRTAGPWPGWVRYWTRTTGGIGRDLLIHDAWLNQLMAGNMRPGQVVADQFGVSRETVRWALIRARDWLSPTGWPPAIPHGFGLSYAERRRAILRAHGTNPYGGRPIDPYVDNYQVPPQLQDAPENLDGDAW